MAAAALRKLTIRTPERAGLGNFSHKSGEILFLGYLLRENIAYFFFGLEAAFSAARTCMAQRLRPGIAFLVH